VSDGVFDAHDDRLPTGKFSLRIAKRREIVPDGHITHICDAHFARRANLSHALALAPSGKSKASSCASRLGKRGVTADRHET
jgi:hypothetical protein